MQDWDDGQLVRAIRQGGLEEHKALLHLNKKLRRILHSILIKKFSMNSCELREELVSNTFINLWKSITKKQFNGDSSIKTYAIAILENLAKGYFVSRRGKEDEKTSELTDEKQKEMDVKNSTIDTNTHIDECLSLALDAFRKENPEDYANIDLITNCELNGKDLAAMLGKPYGASRQYLTELRKKMRTYIEEFCNQQEN